MLKIFLALAVVLGESAFSNSKSELIGFADKIIVVLSNQSRIEYQKLLHPRCPINEARLKARLQERWSKRATITVKKVEEVFDKTVKFHQQPDAVLNIQVWIKKPNEKETELVTVIPVGQYKGELKIIDYPCFSL